MRTTISNPQVSLLKYGIREIVDTAQKIKELDPSCNFVWENIGDPIAKGWPVPQFLKQIIIDEVNRPGDEVFGYTHSRGNPQARKWVVEYSKKYAPASQLNYEYVLFTSGLGAAISALYHMLPKGARIIQPTPAYPTHASMESFAASEPPILYNLDPDNNWEPDFAHLEAQIKANPQIAGILIINPNNPTGAVYSEQTLEKIIQLAEKYNLMIISDEVYFRMVFNGHKFSNITQMACGQSGSSAHGTTSHIASTHGGSAAPLGGGTKHGRVPLIVLRGLSKDIPWPGGRCGWIEFHNLDLDPDYKNYCESVKKRVLMEVCSVTLPQVILPKIYDHPNFTAWNKQYNQELESTANMIAEILSELDVLKVNRTNGAFYMMPLFKEGVLNRNQTLPIKNVLVKQYIEKEVNKPDFPLDQRFTYYLLANTGIVVVPASGFFSPYHGFRITTLERDPARRKDTYTRLAKAIDEYVKSA